MKKRNITELLLYTCSGWTGLMISYYGMVVDGVSMWTVYNAHCAHLNVVMLQNSLDQTYGHPVTLWTYIVTVLLIYFTYLLE